MQPHNYISRIAGELGIILLACCGFASADSGSATKTVYTISTLYGGGSNGDGGPAIQAILTQPEGIAVDMKGNVYIADAADHRVRRISPDGMIQTIAGTGVAGFSGDGGPAETAQLNTPYGLCLDASGNLYIADLSNARVRRISNDGTISTFAGGGTVVPGGNGDGGNATDAKLQAPRNLTFDSAGNLYISDFSGQRIYRVTSAGTLTTIAGSGTSGFSGDGASALTAKLSYPAGLAVDAKGVLYIADSGNKRVRRVNKDVISTVVDAQGAQLPVNTPTGLGIDRSGSLYIQDGSTTTLRISPAGEVTSVSIGGRDIYIDVWDRMYSTGGTSASRFMGGSSTLLAGTGTMTFAGDGLNASAGRFDTPLGIFRDGAGNLYIADSGNRRIRQINAGGMLASIAGTSTKPGADAVLATQTKLAAPSSVALNSKGEIFFSDTAANRIRRIALDGTISTVIGSDEASAKGDGWYGIYATLNGPTAIAFDKDDTLFIADTGNNRIRTMTAMGTVYTFAGGGTDDGPDGSLATETSLKAPAGVAVDSTGTVYIADTGNNRVRTVDANGHIGTLPSSSLMAPTGLRVASNGDVYIIDSGTNRILRVAAGGTTEAIAGSGKRGFSGDDGPAISADLAAPADLILEADGSILFTDSANNRIRKLAPQQVTVTPPPVTPPAGQSALAIVNGASFQEGAIAPGELISIFGTGLGPDEGVTAKLNADGVLESEVGGTQVLFDGRAAPLFYVQGSQINAQVPYEIYGRAQTDLSIVVGGHVVATASVPVKNAAPAFLTTGKGTGQALAVNQDGKINSFENPAPLGTVLVLYATGDGEISSAFKDGQPADATEYKSPVTVSIGGQPVELLYAGKAPGLVALMQINVRIPAGFTHTGIQDVVMMVNGELTQKDVTLVLR